MFDQAPENDRSRLVAQLLDPIDQRQIVSEWFVARDKLFFASLNPKQMVALCMARCFAELNASRPNF